MASYSQPFQVCGLPQGHRELETGLCRSKELKEQCDQVRAVGSHKDTAMDGHGPPLLYCAVIKDKGKTPTGISHLVSV